MSNVGVRIGGEQNSGPKGSEVSEAESNAFKGFDSIVAVLRRAQREHGHLWRVWTRRKRRNGTREEYHGQHVRKSAERTT